MSAARVRICTFKIFQQFLLYIVTMILLCSKLTGCDPSVCINHFIHSLVIHAIGCLLLCGLSSVLVSLSLNLSIHLFILLLSVVSSLQTVHRTLWVSDSLIFYLLAIENNKKS
uniref:Uncharacterized protein n=1 Tax=Octopus bimaculoides TaxID=37653 RepID=A0A0L8H0F7_OCTBM